MYYQEINEILARGMEETMPPAYLEEIGQANAYLLSRQGKMPDWLEGFLASNRDKLVETICRVTASGISSVQGYREGYFNEIVQNANDLHYGEAKPLWLFEPGDVGQDP